MKISTTMLGGIALLGMTGLASAQTTIYLTGSSAFRASTINEIGNLLTNNGGGYTTANDNAGSSNITSSNAVTWTGGNVGGTPVTIKASFSGSGAGVQSVAGAPNFPVSFLPDGATGKTNPDPRTSTNPHDAEVPDIALSDVYQGTTQFNRTFNGITYAKLTDNVVGVVAFTFAGSSGFPGNKNMTPQIAQTLYPGGLVPLSEFTGNPGTSYPAGGSGDDNIGVIATGRDDDSGTRLTAMAETNVGVNTTLNQYQPTITGGTVTSLALYQAQPINGVQHPDGDGGEASGSSLRKFLTYPVSTAAAQNVDGTLTGGYLVTYLGVSDFNAVSGSNGPAVALNYCGVTESQANIIEGTYTFWGYEHLDYLSNISGVKSNFATTLAGQIKGSTSATLLPNVSVGDMKVRRFADGGSVSSRLH